MYCPVENTVEHIESNPGAVAFVTANSTGEPSNTKVKNNSRWGMARSRASVFTVSPETFIWLELSMVAQVECVIVERQENGKQFGVITIINERDPDIRKKIYAREKAVIDANPGLYFDFYVRSRMNRDLAELIGKDSVRDKDTAVFLKRLT